MCLCHDGPDDYFDFIFIQRKRIDKNGKGASTGSPFPTKLDFLSSFCPVDSMHRLGVLPVHQQGGVPFAKPQHIDPQ
jgi:hypothetical protein